jgi:hypothetical protein
MTHNYVARTIALGCMLVVFAGFARADIVQCVDDTRAVTYTDIPCRNGDDAARVAVLINPSAAGAKVAPSKRTFAAPRKVREAISVKKRESNRGLALDVTTLKAARSSMLLNDQESYFLRQQKLAALDLKDQRWFNFGD